MLLHQGQLESVEQVTGYSFRRRFYPKRLTSSANNRDRGTWPSTVPCAALPVVGR